MKFDSFQISNLDAFGIIYLLMDVIDEQRGFQGRIKEHGGGGV